MVPSFETAADVEPADARSERSRAGQRAAARCKTHVKAAGDPDLEQALKRIELQVSPAVLAALTAPARRQPARATSTGSAAAVADQPAERRPQRRRRSDPDDPNEAYRAEVMQALNDAMLDHSSSLGIGPNEWLTIAARGNDERPRLAPADSDAQTRRHPRARRRPGGVPRRPDFARGGPQAHRGAGVLE